MNRIAIVCVSLFVVTLQSYAADGPFEADWNSLRQHNEAPDWFRDAKFGIYFHWGVYSVPAFGNEWYPRHMHIKTTKEYKHHIETYGDPSEFGYHDFIPMFTAKNFDPDEWVDLFVKAGAKYVGPVAEHHDGFAMWDSELTPFNSWEMGPHWDITGSLEKAARKRDLKFVATFHHARNNQHLINKNGRLEWTGHYIREEGLPTLNPAYRMLYGNLPRHEFLDLWLGKIKEVIDNYHPDLIWFDSWLDEIPASYQMEMAKYYFNDAVSLGKEVVLTVKQTDLPLEVAVEDFEKGRADSMRPDAWLTDDTLSKGSWCYTEDLKIKPLREVLHSFIDIVSKNGQLLLNVSPKADGTIPQDQRDVLLAMGKWLDQFGEAIYGTRPFIVYGEGPTKLQQGGHFIKEVEYTPQDIRYTKKGNKVYAILLGNPGGGNTIQMKEFGNDGAAKNFHVTDIAMMGSNTSLKWEQTSQGLLIVCPNRIPDETAFVFEMDVEPVE